MHVTAHPDDENNALLAKQSQGQGLRVILATATRGNGGQNEIGPELFEALGVLRTEELRAAHRFDGAEQMFARAIDFGYSFSVDESFRKWGKEEILGDYVRLIRMTRPDVMITMRPDLPGGGQHHQASALIGLEAFRAAGDREPLSGAIEAGPAGVAAVEGLQGRLLRLLPRRAGAASQREARARRGRCLRSAARAHLLRDRQRGAGDAQVPGLRPAARIARIVPREVPARRQRDSRAEGQGRARPDRRRGPQRGGPRAIRRARSVRSVNRAAEGDRDRARRSREGGTELGARRRLAISPAGPRRDARTDRVAGVERALRGRQVRDWLPPGEVGGFCSSRPSSSPGAFASRRWQTTGWWHPARS